VTFVPVLDRYLMAYTAFGTDGPRIAVAHSQDGYRWERLGLASFAPDLPQGDDKDGVFSRAGALANGVSSLAIYHRADVAALDDGGRGAVPTLLALAPYERECTRIGYIPLEPG